MPAGVRFSDPRYPGIRITTAHNSGIPIFRPRKGNSYHLPGDLFEQHLLEIRVHLATENNETLHHINRNPRFPRAMIPRRFMFDPLFDDLVAHCHPRLIIAR